MQESGIQFLYYITHIDNLPSILARGIFSHDKIVAEGVQNTPIYDEGIVNIRRNRPNPTGKSLWSYANLFFQPRNPMLYRLLRGQKQNLAVLVIDKRVLSIPGIFLTDGIAASNQTRFYNLSAGLEMLRNQKEIIQSNTWVSWTDTEQNRLQEIYNQLMAECLVPNHVHPTYITHFIVADYGVKNVIQPRLSDSNMQKLLVDTDIGNSIFTPSFTSS